VIPSGEIYEFFFDANMALIGAGLFYWSKSIADALNNFAVKCYEKFPQLKILPGSQNAGTELNYKITFIFLRVIGVFLFGSAMGFIILYLRFNRV